MAIDFSSFSSVFAWVIAHGYFFIFLVMCVEGPVATTAAGFAAALGYFNPWFILIISILGDLIPDSIYYFIGYSSRFAFIEKIGVRFGLTQNRINGLESKFKKHFGKSMVVLKLTPVIPTFGFLLVGYLKLSFLRFTKFSAVVTIPKSILFLLLGYFFGQVYNINQYLHYASIFFPVAIGCIAFVVIAYQRATFLLAEKIEKL